MEKCIDIPLNRWYSIDIETEINISKEDNKMEKWLVYVTDDQASGLRKYGRVFSWAGGIWFELIGDSLQEAADDVLIPAVHCFAGCHVIKRPEHVEIEDDLREYANIVERTIKIIIPCVCSDGHGGKFKKYVTLRVKKQIIDISEMREALGESRAEFARRYNIPVRTLENWEAGKNQCPAYVRELLARAVGEDVQKKEK